MRDDHSVTGADFYIMHFVNAHVLNSAQDAETVLDEAGRVRLAFDLVDKLVELQKINPDEVGLGDLSKRKDFIARQPGRWMKQFNSVNGSEKYPEIVKVHDQLLARIPEQKETVLVHADYRLENVMVNDQGEIQAVLDWEVCTLGDPLSDISYILTFWPHPDHEYPLNPGPSLAPGFPNQDALLQRYVEKSGREIFDIKDYLAFQYWRMAAVIVKGIQRMDAGGATSPVRHWSNRTSRDRYFGSEIPARPNGYTGHALQVQPG